MTMTSFISQHMLVSTPTAVAVSLFLARATLLLLAAVIIAAALRRASAGVRHMVWAAVLGGVVLLPLLSYWMPLRLAVLPRAIWSEVAAAVSVTGSRADAERATSPLDAAAGAAPGEMRNERLHRVELAPPSAGHSALPGRGAELASGIRSGEVDGPAARSALPSSPGAPTAPRSTDVLPANPLPLPLALSLLWAIGTALLLARLLLGMAAVRRVLRRATALEGSEWTVPLWEVSDRLGLARAPRLLHSPDVSMPFACGLLRPAIVMPAGAERWDDERRRAVLFHELAHVRRCDILGHTLGRIACAFYWFHPLVWTAARHLRSESESACDDLVLTSGTRASDYAHHLLEIVTGARHANAPVTALAMARPREFEGRMLAILDPERRRAAPRPLQAAATIVGLGALTLSVSAMAPAMAPAAAPRQTVKAAAPAAARDSSALSDAAASPSPPAAGTVVPAGPAPIASASDTGEAASDDTFERAVSSAVERGIQSASERTSVALANAVHPGPLDDWEGYVPDMDIQVSDAVGRAVSSAVRGAVRLNFGAGRGGSGAHVVADSGATDLLVKLLASDTDAHVRRTAAWALAQREPADSHAVSDALSAALARDTSASVREMAAWGLGQLGGSGDIRALGDALRGESDERVRTTIAWALGTIGDASSAADLDAAMADRSSKVRARAAWALGQVEPDAAPAGLLAALRDSSVKVRLAAAWALGQIEDPASLDALSNALTTEKDHEIRDAELRALILLGDASESALQELLDSPDPEVRLKVTRAIVGFRGVRPWPWPWPMPRPMP